MVLTRSRSGISKQITKSTPRQMKGETSEDGKLKRPALSKYNGMEDAKLKLIKLKPKFNAKPAKKMDIIRYIDCLRTKNTLDESIKCQLDELKKYEVFKDMNIDIRTVKLLMSGVGDYDDKDRRLLELIQKPGQGSDEEWMELYGIVDKCEIRSEL